MYLSFSEFEQKKNLRTIVHRFTNFTEEII
jgi:hypothetical protein